jgi:hypothetical protein
MSEKRISISKNGFLLYSEAIIYCLDIVNNNNTPEDLEKVVIPKLSQKIKDAKDKDEYINILTDKIQRKATKEKLNSLYSKITTQIRKEDEQKPSSINRTSKIAHYFEDIKSVYPEVSNLQYFIEKFIEPQFKDITNNLNKREDKPINDLFGTTWYLYYHEYEVAPSTRQTVISRLVLRINSESDICLFEKWPNHDFKGGIDLERSGHSNIIMNFESIHPSRPSKKLQIRLIIEEGISQDSIFFGQYIDFESTNVIVSGTIVIENVLGCRLPKTTESKENQLLVSNSRYFKKRKIDFSDDEAYDVVMVKLAYYCGWEKYIPKYIAYYLTDKWMNHHKTKSISPGSNLEKLGYWLKGQQKKEIKFNSIIEYDCFLITPIGDLGEIGDKEYFKEINQYLFKSPWLDYTREQNKLLPNEVYEAVDNLQESNLKRIYYTPRVKKIADPLFSGEGDSQAIILDEIEKMKRSRFVILILPIPFENYAHHSTMFMKIGWAMEQEKHIIIFPLAEDVLPKLLLHQTQVLNIHISHPVSIKQIPDKLINDFGNILEQ